MHLKIGTRGSRLARRQWAEVGRLLAEEGVEAEEVIITTSGDALLDRAIHQVSYGAFVRELDAQVLGGEIDAAVHSMKDIPADLPEGLVIAAVLPRASPFDLLITRDGRALDGLPQGAVVGTASVRRRAQLLWHRPDLVIENLRGNIETRLRRLERGEYDAIILAEAGVRRLGLTVQGRRLPFTPSPNQGAIAVTARADSPVLPLLRELDHRPTRAEVETERRIMERVGGGCAVPLGILARHDGSGIEVEAEVLTTDGRQRRAFSKRAAELDLTVEELGKELLEWME
ncbi:MAG: hydroxymethylbilane synthase, partial [Candidatus Bipolaricaulia bacterium]